MHKNQGETSKETTLNQGEPKTDEKVDRPINRDFGFLVD